MVRAQAISYVWFDECRMPASEKGRHWRSNHDRRTFPWEQNERGVVALAISSVLYRADGSIECRTTADRIFTSTPVSAFLHPIRPTTSARIVTSSPLSAYLRRVRTTTSANAVETVSCFCETPDSFARGQDTKIPYARREQAVRSFQNRRRGFERPSSRMVRPRGQEANIRSVHSQANENFRRREAKEGCGGFDGDTKGRG